MRSIYLVLLVCMLMPGWVVADHEEARKLLEAGEIAPLEKIIANLRKEGKGTLLEAELDVRQGRYVYEVEVLDENGRVWEYLFDAATAELIRRRRDD